MTQYPSLQGKQLVKILKKKKFSVIRVKGSHNFLRHSDGRCTVVPVDLRREVLDYVEFLLKKYKGTKSTAKKFRFDWEGELSEMRGEFTSVELQHRTLEWR